MINEAGSDTHYSERDIYRKKALVAAFGITSVRELGPDPEYVSEMGQGLEFCRALDKVYRLHAERTPVRMPDLPIWEAFRTVFANDTQSRISPDLSKLHKEAEDVKFLLESFLEGKEVGEDRLEFCESFFQKASTLLD